MAEPGDEPGVVVSEALSASPRLLAAMRRLVPQLSSTARPLELADLEGLVESPTTRLLVAAVPSAAADGGDDVVGTLSLVLYRIPTGVRAVIDDVVVDDAVRGRGIGSELVRAALRLAEEQGARHVDLTSRPDRAAANRLYLSLGFVKRETNVYRYEPGWGGGGGGGA